GALVAVPLVTDGSAVGALGLVLAVGTVLDDEERGFLMALGLQCGQALERARLAEAERAAQAERALAQQRLAFLAEASALLAGSLDYETTLRRVAETVVPALADWCAVDLVERDGEVRRVAIAHVDPAKVSWARELAERYPYDPGAPHGLAKVLRTGEPEFWPEITDAMLAAAARDEEHLALLRSTGFSSAMIVPLVARGRTIGALSFIAAESGRHYTEADLMFAEEVARRAALAVENARLLRAARAAQAPVPRPAIRARALAEASQAFAEARLDAYAVLAVVAERTAALIGDACIIRLLSEDGAWLVPAAVFHPDPQASRVTREVLAAVRHRATEGLSGRVVATGEPLLIAETTPEALRHHTKREYLPHLEAFPVYGLLVVPLRALGRTVGTVSLSRSAPGRPYTLDDQAFLLDIVERAGQALENAWLYRDAQRAVTVAERHAAQLHGLTDAALSIN
ncbi:MAG: GAF domain-containing protein, partial [Thermomicrobiaceae bacterium]|nr:GAF domain-containing protein [Thermomicrobiaceae bacterium]